MKKNIDEVFGDKEEVTEIFLDEVTVESNGTESDISKDYNFVRENLIRSIIRGSELIDESIREVKTMPSAQAVVAASSAVKTLTDASKSLLDLHEKIRNIEKEKTESNLDSFGEDKIVLKTTLSDLIKQIEEEDNTAPIAKEG